MSYKKGIIIILVLLLGFTLTGIGTNLFFANRSTDLPPEEITYTIDEPTDMQKVFENQNFTFYFRDSRDVLAIYDTRNQVTHKTGLDIAYSADIRWDCDDAVFSGDSELIDKYCVPLEDRLNEDYIDFANSLITIEYFDEKNNLFRLSSANRSYASSSFSKLSTDDHWALDIEFETIDVSLRVHAYFSEKGVEFEIKPEEVTGEDIDMINNIIIAPFLDAQGGKIIPFDGVEYDRDNLVNKPSNDGYIFIPDGPGALLRFKRNEVSISAYSSYVYGRDVTSTLKSDDYEPSYLTPKKMTLPVFGISIGDDTEAAFIAYATSGDEYLKVTAMPYNNKTWYNHAYASFVVNETYWQDLSSNNTGGGFTTTREDIEIQNYKIQYHFLAGDGTTDGLPASYVGMALAYKGYLEENGLQDLKDSDAQSIPLRLDFLMSDVKKDLFGYEDVVVTDLKDIEDIFGYFNNAGIDNINSGLLGYRNGGITAGRVGDSKVSDNIGGRNDLKSLLEVADSYGYDVSFSTDYSYITNLQYNSLFNPSPAKHVSGKYYSYTINNYQTIDTFNLLRTNKAFDWIESDLSYANRLSMNSITIDGISNTLFSEYERNLTRADNKDAIIEAFSGIEGMEVNAVNPNAYLLPYVDRYLEAPIYSSHFLIETDTVPFLQLVLASNMEMYASYGNFNITTANDVLRMIDYNVYPSFILTEDSSYHLVNTNSFIYYSTQFDFYDEEILRVYNEINTALKEVQDADWIGRTVIAKGVVKNVYSNGVEIYVNYNNTDYNEEVFVEANQYLVMNNG